CRDSYICDSSAALARENSAHSESSASAGSSVRIAGDRAFFALAFNRFSGAVRPRSLPRTWGRGRNRHLSRKWCFLPAAAQRLVDGDQAGGRVRTALREGILGLELGALGVEHGQKVRYSAVIAGTGEAGGGAAG